MSLDARISKLLENWPAKVISLVIAIFIMFLYNLTRLDQRLITVQLNISEGRSFVPSTDYPKTVRVVIRGERDQIYRIREADIVASLDLTRYQSEGVFRVPVKLERRGEARDIDPLELRADPAEIPIGFERLAAKRVAISPTFKGFLEQGYELISYEIVPSEIAIEGPSNLIANTKDISTDVIELSGKNRGLFTHRSPFEAIRSHQSHRCEYCPLHCADPETGAAHHSQQCADQGCESRSSVGLCRNDADRQNDALAAPGTGRGCGCRCSPPGGFQRDYQARAIYCPAHACSTRRIRCRGI